MNSCLIAGCGYLGFRAATLWRTQNCRVSAITRSLGRAAEFEASGLNPLVLDLSNPQKGDVLIGSDIVLWSVGMDRSSDVSRQQIWIDGLRWLIRNLPVAPRRFLYVSSTSVYGAADDTPIDESFTTNPSTEGGECCVLAERLARDECQKLFPETDVVALRMAGIYGPNRLLRRVADLQNCVPLQGDPDHWLNLIHVDDAVKMINFVAAADEVPSVINVVNTGSVTRQQYYSELAQLASTPPPIFGSMESSGRSSGNKRVISRHCGDAETSINAGFLFDDVLEGLRDAWRRTASPT